MDSKFYVSYETARLLNEKGYVIKRDFLTPVYNENGCLYWSNHEDLSDNIPAITKSEAIDWLEGKGLVIVLSPATILQKDGTNTIVWRFYIVRGTEGWYNNYGDYKTRLEAEEAAIIKTLELIDYEKRKSNL